MPVIHEITDLTAPELDIYARLTQAQLRNRLGPEKGIFIAESPKVIARALDAGYQPLSLLMELKQITGPAAEILTRCVLRRVLAPNARQHLVREGLRVDGDAGSAVFLDDRQLFGIGAIRAACLHGIFYDLAQVKILPHARE